MTSHDSVRVPHSNPGRAIRTLIRARRRVEEPLNDAPGNLRLLGRLFQIARVARLMGSERRTQFVQALGVRAAAPVTVGRCEVVVGGDAGGVVDVRGHAGGRCASRRWWRYRGSPRRAAGAQAVGGI